MLTTIIIFIILTRKDSNTIAWIKHLFKTIRSIILRRHGEQLVMPHATTFQAQHCNQTQGLALHRQYSEQTLKIPYISQHSCDYASQQSKYLLLNWRQEQEKTIDVAHSKGRPTQKYQMHVFWLTSMSKIWQGFPIPIY